MSLTCALILNLFHASSSKVGPTPCLSTQCGTSTMQEQDDVQFLQANAHISSVALENIQWTSQLAEKTHNEVRSQRVGNKSTTTFYQDSDFVWLEASNSSRKRLPRVLIYTWCTTDYLEMFLNEVYWKSCYAHAHGFDLVFSSTPAPTGVKMDTSVSYIDKTYANNNMWGWVNDIGKYLFSGRYDYVFFTGADVLINPVNLLFPIWAYDQGHPITIMDQDYVRYGFNENGMLFKPSQITRKFLDELFEFRKDFYIQGDNGPYMEMMLRVLGQDAESQGKPGYENTCEPLCKLNESMGHMVEKHFDEAVEVVKQYSTCFFSELERLAGAFQQRESNTIGFSKTFLDSQGNDIRNSEPILDEKQCEQIPRSKLPWANCDVHVRDNWPNWKCHCFAFHWNGPKSPDSKSELSGTCPDPTFNFAALPFNKMGIEDRIADILKLKV